MLSIRIARVVVAEAVLDVGNVWRLAAEAVAASDFAPLHARLPAAGRPFAYFPLGHHLEQRFHVAHREAALSGPAVRARA